MVIKADTLGTQVDKDVDDMSTLSVLAAAGKIVSSETLKGVAQRLAALHKPININYRKRFGLKDVRHSKDNAAPSDKQSSKQYHCFQCKKKISERVANFCRNNKKRFGGKAYCFDCQKAFPITH
jgi:ribosomal protein L37AE/L43A